MRSGRGIPRPSLYGGRLPKLTWGRYELMRHGRIELIESKCTSCMVCARECPVWCIEIDSHTEVDPHAPQQQTGRGMRSRTHNVLDRFEIDWSTCMFCGICVEECPFDALQWAEPILSASPELSHLNHGIESLAAPTNP